MLIMSRFVFLFLGFAHTIMVYSAEMKVWEWGKGCVNDRELLVSLLLYDNLAGQRERGMAAELANQHRGRRYWSDGAGSWRGWC